MEADFLAWLMLLDQSAELITWFSVQMAGKNRMVSKPNDNPIPSVEQVVKRAQIVEESMSNRTSAVLEMLRPRMYARNTFLVSDRTSLLNIDSGVIDFFQSYRLFIACQGAGSGGSSAY